MEQRFSEQIFDFLKEADSGVPVKKLLAETLLEAEVIREVLKKKWRPHRLRREVVREMKSLELTERRALAVFGMSGSSLRYEPAADRNDDLLQQIVSMAKRYRRYGSEMIYLKLLRDGLQVNHKRVERREDSSSKAPPQEGAAGRPAATDSAVGGERSVVDRFCLRPDCVWPRTKDALHWDRF